MSLLLSSRLAGLAKASRALSFRTPAISSLRFIQASSRTLEQPPSTQKDPKDLKDLKQDGTQEPIEELTEAEKIKRFEDTYKKIIEEAAKKKSIGNVNSKGHGGAAQLMTYDERRKAGLLTPTQKVVEAGKDFTYLIVIFAGLALSVVFGYCTFTEIFSKVSPSSIYDKSAETLLENDRLKQALGDNIHVSATPSENTRIRTPAYNEYEVNGEVYTRMRYFLRGPRNTGTVHLETKNTGTGFEYRYLFVEIPGQGLPSKNLIIVDNR